MIRLAPVLVIGIAALLATACADDEHTTAASTPSQTPVPTHSSFVVYGTLVTPSPTPTPAPTVSPTPIPIHHPPPYTVVIDAGHGGLYYWGASAHDADGNRYIEKDLALEIALRLHDLLLADEQSRYVPILTRDGDYTLTYFDAGEYRRSLIAEQQARVDLANEAQADIIVSIHFNSWFDAGQRGMETYCNPDRSFGQVSCSLAFFVQDALLRSVRDAGYDIFDRGTRNDAEVGGDPENPHSFLLGTNANFNPSFMPGVISEVLFLSHPADLEFLRRPDAYDVLARGYKAGIDAYFAWLNDNRHEGRQSPQNLDSDLAPSPVPCAPGSCILSLSHPMAITEVPLEARSLDAFAPIVGTERVDQIVSAAGRLREILNGGVVWNVNSTATGGGVAEMLRGLLPYARGLGLDSRWLVIEGDQDFFRVTKRLHHALHGSVGDGSPLDEQVRTLFEKTSDSNADGLRDLVRAQDVVILHDPQTAALVQPLIDMGTLVIWRSHIGTEIRNEETEQGWAFLKPYVEGAHALVFSRRQYVPDWADERRLAIIPPSIDPFSPKNLDMDDTLVRDILICAGILGDGEATEGPPTYIRHDGSPAHLVHCADVVCLGPPPDMDDPVVLQVSRWDPLKDPVGVMHGFAEYLKLDGASRACLILAGPSVKSINDDPEQPATMDQLISEWRALPQSVRRRVRLVNLPMTDLDENAAMVNALQRHAAVVVQKSLREGFGLTVTEAMWKARPVVASAVGGIQDQIIDGLTGLLLRDPTDRTEFAAALHRLLSAPGFSEELGRNARQAVIEKFLADRHLLDYDRLLSEIVGGVRITRPT